MANRKEVGSRNAEWGIEKKWKVGMRNGKGKDLREKETIGNHTVCKFDLHLQ